VALRDELAEGVGEGERVLGVGVKDEGGKALGRGGRFVVDSGEGDLEDGATGLAQVVVRDVGVTPTILLRGRLAPRAKVRPMGSWPGKKVLAKASLTMAALYRYLSMDVNEVRLTHSGECAH
jgi:hypothetical protein